MDVKKPMLDALENLGDEDFKKFHWQLWNGVETDIDPIPKAKLQKADRSDVVDCMVEKYSDEAGKITVQALRKMNQNHCAKTLESKLQKVQQSEPEDRMLQCLWRISPSSPTGVDHTALLKAAKSLRTEFSEKTQIMQVYIPKDKSQRKRSALLITNIRFKHSEDNRAGAARDEENMEWLLTALGYRVEKYRDQTGQEISARVEDFAARPEHKDSDSTFVVLMSHGKRIQNKDAILGVNYHYQQNPNDVFFVDDIFSSLSSENCRALTDKPKVILIQACRGKHPGAVEIQSDSIVHREKDFVCFKSCLPDISAWRNSSNGSYFIMYILEVFCKRAHVDDIMELFRKVTSSMEKDTILSAYGKLMPCIDRTSLPKKLYLFPGL